jgi:DNA-binding response OmpR family regulator
VSRLEPHGASLTPEGADAPRLRVLVVEDDPATRRALHVGLREEGFSVSSADSGDQALRLCADVEFAAVLLDWMLPDRSGIEVLEILRRRGIDVPVLMLTARDSVGDRVTGLVHGADDYLVKPFAFPEVVARLRALLRRATRGAENEAAAGPLHVDVRGQAATCDGRPIALTPRELALLHALVRRAGDIVPRETLAREALHASDAGTRENLIDVHMSRLRRKLEPISPRIAIRTVRGLGFRLEVR